MTNAERGLIRTSEAAEYLGISRRHLYHIAETDPSFPKRIKFGPRYSGYRRESLDAWLRMKEEQAGSA